METRNYSIDFVKVLAMLGVIGLHTFGHYNLDSNISDFFYRTCVVSIPLFFMVSGYLMATKTEVTYKYPIKKILNIIKYVAIICVFYWVVYTIMSREFDLLLLLTTFVSSFIQDGFWWQFWYLGSMILIYIFLPIFLYLKRNSSCFLVLSLLLFVACNTIFVFNITNQYEIGICQTLRIWNWAFYFIIGMFMSANVERIKNMVSQTYLLSFLVGGVIFNFVYQKCFVKEINNVACEYFYCSLPVMNLVITSFLVIIKIRLNNDAIFLIKILSPLFLPVYTFHIFFTASVFRRVLSVGIVWLDSLIMFIFTSIVAITFSYFLMRIKYLNIIFKI